MLRVRVTALAGLMLASAPALAQDGVEVCLLRSTETITAPRKANVYQTELDCGRSPTAEQRRTAGQVHNATDTADALEIAARAGYRVVDSSWRDSYTGRQILGVYTLVRGAADAPPAVDDTLADALPEAEPAPAPVIAEPEIPVEDDEDAALEYTDPVGGELELD